ncbi:MAG: helix-turn-helix domain-containing protein [Oscillospiraceae bacterium]|nr:helix-turn-helix domain-containing protein [Oscillospiraceae bacterium]
MYYSVELFGLLLRRHRENKRLSREYLAELCDISDRCISNIERGKSDPKLSTVLKLCSKCDIDVGKLSELKVEEVYSQTVKM